MVHLILIKYIMSDEIFDNARIAPGTIVSNSNLLFKKVTVKFYCLL